MPAGRTSGTGDLPAAKRLSPVGGGGGARKDLKLIDYSPDEPLVDHKGRSKPMYKPRTPRPRSWHPSRPIRLMLGLFPGTRVMALESVAAGLPYTIVGLLAVVPALFLLIGWSRSVNQIHALAIDERWLLLHASGVLALLIVFELLRLASFFEERTNTLKAPRILAALAAPSLATLIAGPEMMSLWPRLVEAAWFAALVVSVGAISGAVWCAFEGTLQTPRPRRIFRIAGLVVIVALIAAGVLTKTLAPATLHEIASLARAAGFQTLPELLGMLG